MRPMSILWGSKIIHTIVRKIKKPKSQMGDKKLLLLFLSLALDVTIETGISYVK